MRMLILLLLFLLECVAHIGATELSFISGGTLLRSKPFTVPDGSIRSAIATVSGVGCYTLTVNGQLPMPSRLAPGFSTFPSTRLLYEQVDLSKFLKPGETNTVDISLGMCKYGYMDNQDQGLYCVGAHGATATCRAAAFELKVELGSGMQFNCSTAEPSQWMTTTSNNPIRYTHLFHGEVAIKIRTLTLSST